MSRLPSTVRQLLAGLRALIVITVICGIAYPLVVWGIAQGAFHHQANGSLVSSHGRTVGSSLLCQEFTDAKGNPLPQYFQPQAIGGVQPEVHDRLRLRPGLLRRVQPGPEQPCAGQADRHLPPAGRAVQRREPGQRAADAVTASGSGLDPDISPAYAYLQVNRVAAARHLSPPVVRALVTKHIQGRNIGFLGEPRVNVLDLNVALDNLSG